MYVPDDFELYEFLPQQFHMVWHPKKGNRLWRMFDDRLLRTAQALRNRYGPMIANTWHFPEDRREIYGFHQYRGWRPQMCEVGAQLSDHKWGRALDLVPLDEDVEKIRMDILKDPFHEDFKYITAIEMKVGWLHISTTNYDKEKGGILVIYP